VSVLLWVGFLIALVLVASIFLMYYIMQRRRKNMQLQKALAEGRVSMKNLKEPGSEDDDDDYDGDAADKEVEMADLNRSPNFRL